MKQRAITAFFFAAIMIGGIYWNMRSFQLLFTIIAGVMLWEFFGLVFSSKGKSNLGDKVFGLLLGITPVIFLGSQIISISFWWCGIDLPEDPVAEHLQNTIENAGVMFVFLGLIIMPILLIKLFQQGSSVETAVGHYFLGLFYIGLPIILLFSIAMPGAIYSPNRVSALLWLIWTNDVFAYLVGSQFGKTKLFERISPKKTWEGTIGGGICTLAMAWGLSHWIDDYNQSQWLALGIIVALLATPGDLIESMLKRSAGVKDSGTLMPGHGGLLDRFDSFIFVLPFAWLAVILLGG
ncbi:MAG: phosphatidate cytidylyltransferase [Lewinellaceae bacterium]|nr:phosphatidate cytidylyltransferase [Lewinellaceae bacterium]